MPGQTLSSPPKNSSRPATRLKVSASAASRGSSPRSSRSRTLTATGWTSASCSSFMPVRGRGQPVEAEAGVARHAQREALVDHDQGRGRQAEAGRDLRQVLHERQVLVGEEARRPARRPELGEVAAVVEVGAGDVPAVRPFVAAQHGHHRQAGAGDGGRGLVLDAQGLAADHGLAAADHLRGEAEPAGLRRPAPRRGRRSGRTTTPRAARPRRGRGRAAGWRRGPAPRAVAVLLPRPAAALTPTCGAGAAPVQLERLAHDPASVPRSPAAASAGSSSSAG